MYIQQIKNINRMCEVRYDSDQIVRLAHTLQVMLEMSYTQQLSQHMYI